MDWQLLSIVPAIFLVIAIIILLYGAIKALKAKSKFNAFILFAIAIAVGIGFYAIYGKRFFG